MKKLTKEQRKEISARARQAKLNRMKKDLGETVTRKVTLLATGYGTGLLPGLGPVRSSSVAALVGWAGAMALPGKLGAGLEGVGDAGGAVTLHRMGVVKRRGLARDSALRNSFFDPVDEVAGSAGGAAPAAAQVREVERRAFAAGRASGLADGVRAGVAGAVRNDDPEDAELVEVSGGEHEEADGL